MSASLHQATLFGAYLLNQDFITETFCVNKDKPELSCNGKCHLKDMLAMAEDDKQEENQVLIDFAMFPVFIGNTDVFVCFPGCQIVKTNKLISSLVPSYLFAHFHPPEIA